MIDLDILAREVAEDAAYEREDVHVAERTARLFVQRLREQMNETETVFYQP